MTFLQPPLSKGRSVDHAAASQTWPAPLFSLRRWRLPIGGFAANVGFMLIGTVAGQAASVLLSPVLTRLYSPEQFGILSVYTSVLYMLGVVAALGFELAIPIARTESEFANLMLSSTLALFLMTGLVGIAAWLLPGSALDAIALTPLLDYRYLLPIGFLCMGGYYVVLAAATRQGAFGDIARTRISQGLSGPLTQIGLGLAGAGTPGLIVGFVIGQSSGTFLLLSRAVLRAGNLWSAVSWHEFCNTLRRYAHFPLFASWARLLDMAGSGPVFFLLLSTCYSSEVAGFLFLTERVIARPLLIISTSILQVFTGEAGRAVQSDPVGLHRRFWQVMPRHLLLSAAWILLANLAADRAFPVLFGEQWLASIPYLRAMSLGYLALVAMHPVSTMLQLMEHQVLAAGWQAGRLLAVGGAVLLAWYNGWSAVAALWCGSLAQAVACTIMLGLVAVSIHRLRLR